MTKRDELIKALIHVCGEYTRAKDEVQRITNWINYENTISTPHDFDNLEAAERNVIRAADHVLECCVDLNNEMQS